MTTKIEPYGSGMGSIISYKVTIDSEVGYVHFHGEHSRNGPYFCTSCQRKECVHIDAVKRNAKP